MKKIVLFIACTAIIACTPKYEKIKVGMSLTEVESILGKPNHSSSSSSSSTFNGIEIMSSETTCKYNDVGTFEFINDTLISKNK